MWRPPSRTSGVLPRGSTSPSSSISCSSGCPTASSPEAPCAAHWDAECSTCLQPLGGDLELTVAELYEAAPVEGETYPLDGHHIDLELLVRDTVLLDLPLAPSVPHVSSATPRPRPCPACRSTSPSNPSPTTAPPIPGGPRCRSSSSHHPPNAADRSSITMAVPKRRTPRAKTRQRPRASNLAAQHAVALDVPELRRGQAAPHRLRQLRLLRRPPGDRLS